MLQANCNTLNCHIIVMEMQHYDIHYAKMHKFIHAFNTITMELMQAGILNGNLSVSLPSNLCGSIVAMISSCMWQ